MGQQFDSISDRHRSFIEKQKIFFVGTADRFGRINVSPKGFDTFRVINGTQVVWLNLTGRGNETSPHVFNHDRMTIMFCSFDEEPLVLRLYGKARDLHGRENEWDEYKHLFPNYSGMRQIFVMTVNLVSESNGFGVPEYEFVGERSHYSDWMDDLGEEGIRRYWKDQNSESIDGVGTRIVYLKDIN